MVFESATNDHAFAIAACPTRLEQTNEAVMNVRVWPRAAAMAETLWSGSSGANETEALPRLLRQRCRMVQRGVPVTPLQPGFC